MLLVLCGYTATGKDTYQNMLLEKNSNIHRTVSYTTRPMRPNETNGLEYYFIKDTEFFLLAIKGLLLESRSYRTFQNGIETNWYYGLAKSEVTGYDNSIAILDHQGTKEIIDALGEENVKVVYLTCDDDELKRRSKARRDENKEFDRRLEDDKLKFKGIEKIAKLTLNTHGDSNQHEQNINAILALLEDV